MGGQGDEDKLRGSTGYVGVCVFLESPSTWGLDVCCYHFICQVFWTRIDLEAAVIIIILNLSNVVWMW